MGGMQADEDAMAVDGGGDDGCRAVALITQTHVCDSVERWCTKYDKPLGAHYIHSQ